MSVLELEPRPDRGHQLDEAIIEQGHPELEAEGHARAILDVQQRWQVRLAVEVDVDAVDHRRRTVHVEDPAELGERLLGV